MAPQSDVPRVSPDKSKNVSTVSTVLLNLLQKPHCSIELRNKIPPETTKVPRSSQSVQQSERSDAVDGREMFPGQDGQDHVSEGQKIFSLLRRYGRQQVIPEAPEEYHVQSERSQQEDQKTDADRQESSHDVLSRQDLQVHSKFRSSPQAHLETMAEFRPARQICENGQDHVTAGQKIFPTLRQYGRQQVIPEAPEEYQVRSERSQLEDQKTDPDGDRQESRQDVLSWQDLQVHSRVCSSPQAHLGTMTEFRPELQMQITSDTNYSDSETRRGIPETLEEYHVRTEKSQQEDPKTDSDEHRQKSSQDVLPRRDLQLNPRLLTSPQTGLKIEGEFRPELQREITSEISYSDAETQRVIPETPEEYQVKRERSQQVDQKLYWQAMADERPLKPPDRNIPRPMIRSLLTTPNHFQMPSHNYQLMVSHPAKSRETSILSSVYLQNQRNRTDSIEQEVVSQGKLGQRESCCPTFVVDEKQENEQPTPKDSWHRGPRHPLSLAEKQYMERYLDLWATEPNFVQEVAKIAFLLWQKSRNAARNSQQSGRLIICNNRTSFESET